MNQWSIDVALRSWRAYVICRFELIGRFLRRLDFRATFRRVERALPRSDFGAVRLSMLVLAMLIAGAKRVRHVCYLADDPLAERLCGLSRLPG